MPNEENIELIKDRISLRRKKYWTGKLAYAKSHYLSNKKRGIFTYMVDEWDEFEKYKLEVEIEEIINREKGDNNMKFKVLARLSRDYDVAEVGAEEIETVEDLDYFKGLCTSKALEMLDSYSKTKAPVNVSKETYTKTYVPKQENTPYHPAENVSNTEITTKFLKGKQLEHAQKLINKGAITLQQVNNLSSWEEQQALIYSDNNKKILFGK